MAGAIHGANQPETVINVGVSGPGVVDLSLAPTPTVGDSVGEILKILGVDAIGAPGSTAIVALLNDAVKKGGLFASQNAGGLSGAFIPVVRTGNWPMPCDRAA